MRNMKKVISVLTAILMIVCSISIGTMGVSAASYTENGVTYQVDKTSGTARISSYEQVGTMDEIVIPETVDGCTVVGVAHSAFRNNHSIVSITFPKTLIRIEGYAFDGCVNLEEANLDSEITYIGAAAFRGCEKLGSINLGNSLEYIGTVAFKGTGIRELNIPDTCATIEGSAFTACAQLRKVSLPSSLKSIESSLFDDCVKLEAVDIPDGVAYIAEDAFSGCFALESVTMGDSVTRIDQRAFLECKSLKYIRLSESLTSMGINTFWDCDSLEEVTIPASVKNLGFQVFRGCDSLHTVYLNEGVETVGDNAFMNCTSLRSIVIPSTVTTVSGTAFYLCEKITVYSVKDSFAREYAKNAGFGFIGYEIDNEGGAVITAYDCPDTDIEIVPTISGAVVTTIGADAFRGNENIKNIILTSNITKIYDHAFDGCTALENVQFGADKTYIGKYAFANCPEIKNICLPEGVATIDEYAFGYVSDGDSYVPDSEFCVYSSINSTAYNYCVDNNINFRHGLLKEVATDKIVSGMNYIEKIYEEGDKYWMVDILGDVSGDDLVSVRDATNIQKYCASMLTFSEVEKLMADTNFDGIINVRDATKIQKYVASLIDTLYVN